MSKAKATALKDIGQYLKDKYDVLCAKEPYVVTRKYLDTKEQRRLNKCLKTQ